MMTFDEIVRAQARIESNCVRTPVLTCAEFGTRTGPQVSFKAENLQRTGSFKFRGAFHVVSVMTQTELTRGLCTVSSGNHGKALALSGLLRHTKVTVWMPQDAPIAKHRAVESYGAQVETFGRYARSQDDVSARLIEAGGQIYVSSHDDRRIVAGAGTLAIEFFEDQPDLDTIVMPVGGGGGLAGVGAVARGLNPDCRVVGVEPASSGAVARSLRAGRRMPGPVPHTIADGQTLTAPGELTLEIMREVVDEVVGVTDEQIMAAMELLRRSCGMTVEPSGASGAAAVLAGAVRGQRIGVVLTGGNIDEERWKSIFGGFTQG